MPPASRMISMISSTCMKCLLILRNKSRGSCFQQPGPEFFFQSRQYLPASSRRIFPHKPFPEGYRRIHRLPAISSSFNRRALATCLSRSKCLACSSMISSTESVNPTCLKLQPPVQQIDHLCYLPVALFDHPVQFPLLFLRQIRREMQVPCH